MTSNQPPAPAGATLSIIGNSAGVPAPGGACSAYLVETPATKLVLDCGPGALPQLRTKLRMCEIDGVVISHMHTDHFLDLLALNVAVFTEHEEDGGGGPLRRVPVFLPPGALETVAACFHGLTVNVAGSNASRWQQGLDCREYAPGERLTLGDAVVEIVGPTQHSTLCFGMRVEAGGATLGYTGDTARCDAAIDIGRDADLFLAECTLMEPGPASYTHIAAGELGEVAQASGCGRLLATHVTRTDPAWLAELGDRIAATYSGPIDVVRLGATYDLRRGGALAAVAS